MTELLLDFAELLEATLELDLTLDEDFALELDFTLELDEGLDPSLLLRTTLLLDFSLLDVIPAEVPGSPFLLLLDCDPGTESGVTDEEEPSFTLEEDMSLTLEEDSSSMLLDDSSSRGAKLLSSSPHAAKNANTVPTANNLANFIFLLQILSPKYNQNALAYCKKCM